jgi:hypothetical protein
MSFPIPLHSVPFTFAPSNYFLARLQLPAPSTSDDDDIHCFEDSLARRIVSTQTASLSNGPIPSKDIAEDFDDDVVLLDDDMMASVDSTVAPKMYQSWADINHEVSMMAYG